MFSCCPSLLLPLHLPSFPPCTTTSPSLLPWGHWKRSYWLYICLFVALCLHWSQSKIVQHLFQNKVHQAKYKEDGLLTTLSTHSLIGFWTVQFTLTLQLAKIDCWVNKSTFVVPDLTQFLAWKQLHQTLFWVTLIFSWTRCVRQAEKRMGLLIAIFI